jgi:hypothetical protein
MFLDIASYVYLLRTKPLISRTRKLLTLMACPKVSALGFGSHLWSLKDGALLQILRLFYISEIIYVVVLALTKASIVTMYLRIFWAYRSFYIACYVVLTFIFVSSSVVTILTIRSCQPVEFFWDRDIAGGSCLNITALAYANSGLAVLHDLVIIILPISMLWSLQMSRKKKVFIGVMFALGGIGLVATIVRLQTLKDFGTTPDPSWEWVPVVYWTSVELSAGIIASCLPAVRTLLERFFKFFALSVNASEPSTFIRLKTQRRPSRKDSTPAAEHWTDDGAGETILTSSKNPTSAAASVVRDTGQAGSR